MTANSISLVYQPNEQSEGNSVYANNIFCISRQRAIFGQLLALITGKRRLPTLSSRLAGRWVCKQHYQGLCTVEVKRIVGTESRSNDFDPNFNPLDDHLRDRWIRVAELWMSETRLPAIDLIKVDEEYFVRDGHHRVSVAHAIGCQFIDAQVTVMEV